jgi:transposase
MLVLFLRERGVDGEVIEGASSHTTAHMSSRVHVIARVSGRRIFTVEQKLAILRDAFGPEGSVREACERHEVSSGQVYTWRRNAMSGQLGFVRPATPVFAEVEVAAQRMLPSPVGEGAGGIGIELPSGIKLSVDAAVDGEALARVLSVLGR